MILKSCDLKLDWLSFTYHAPLEDLDEFRNFFTSFESFQCAFPELDEIWSECNFVTPYAFYNHVVAFTDNVRFSYNDSSDGGFVAGERSDMGVNVSIPSHALEWFFEVMGLDPSAPGAISDLFRILYDRNCKPSRIDLCFDDYDMKYCPNDYIDFHSQKRIRTKFHQIQLIYNTRNAGGGTLYFGSRKAGKLLRIYDKNYESKGEIKAIRYEFEVHQKHAVDMFHYFMEHDSLDFFGYLLSWFQIIDLDDSNRSRCSVNEEWASYFIFENEEVADSVFCEEFNSKLLPIKVPHYTKQQKVAAISYWIEHYCLPNIAGYISCVGWENFHEIINKNINNIPPKWEPYNRFYKEVNSNV